MNDETFDPSDYVEAEKPQLGFMKGAQTERRAIAEWLRGNESEIRNLHPDEIADAIEHGAHLTQSRDPVNEKDHDASRPDPFDEGSAPVHGGLASWLHSQTGSPGPGTQPGRVQEPPTPERKPTGGDWRENDCPQTGDRCDLGQHCTVAGTCLNTTMGGSRQ